MPRPGLALLLLGIAATPLAAADPDDRRLRVGSSGDYAPFSSGPSQEGAGPAGWSGFDLAVARAYAGDRGLALEIVRFRWPELLADLADGRFDVAMSGITVRPERSAAGRFTVPVAESGALVLVRAGGRLRREQHVDRSGVRVVVNAGGHLERVARARFPRATRIAVADNRAVLPALRDGAADAAISDTLEARGWLAEVPGLATIGPLTRDRKAYLVRPDHPELAADLDAWLLEREADGSLAGLRDAQLGAADLPATATPLLALLAAVDERLALMPKIGAAKRRQGYPLAAPAREERVIEAALGTVRSAAAARGAAPPADAAVRALFRVQIEAAKEIQALSFQDGAVPEEEVLPPLEDVLRPALLRLGERIARLVVALPGELEAAALRETAHRELRAPYLSRAAADAIADAIAAASKRPAAAPVSG